jgi:hypothetical protein
MTPEEALARIAALCDEDNGVMATTFKHPIWAEDVRYILAEVSPEPGGVLLDVVDARIAHGWYLDVSLREKASAEETALAARLQKGMI